MQKKNKGSCNTECLISIVIITYNSAKYVLETLDSLKNQAYDNIELIISDDASKDNTVPLCNQWIQENKDHFAHCELITVEVNTGIPANCNRGVVKSNGEWIKILAGDDIFLPNAIASFVEAINNTTSPYKIVQTNSKVYDDTFISENYLYDWKDLNNLSFFDYDATEQNKLLKYHYFLNTPGIFFHHSVFDQYLFFEEFKRLEDYPFFIWCTSQGIPIRYIDLDTVGYRIHQESVQNIDDKPFFPKETLSLKKAVFNKFYPKKMVDYPMAMIKIYTLLDQIGLNNRSIPSKAIYYVLRNLNQYIVQYQLNKAKKIAK